MRRLARGVVAFLVALLLGCGDDTGAPSSADEPAATPSVEVSDAEDTGSVVIDDSMVDDTWGWLEGADASYGTIELSGGDQIWSDFTGRMSAWVPARLDEGIADGTIPALRNMEVSTSVTVDEGGGLVGVNCRLQPPGPDSELQWYEFVVNDGFAAIRWVTESRIRTLAETRKVAMSPGEPIRVTARCIDDDAGRAVLSLAVDDAQLLTTTVAAPLGEGLAGLQVWTRPLNSPMDIAWHDFVLTRA